MCPDPRIAVIDKNPLRPATLEAGLRAAGHMTVAQIDDAAELLHRIRAKALPEEQAQPLMRQVAMNESKKIA